MIRDWRDRQRAEAEHREAEHFRTAVACLRSRCEHCDWQEPTVGCPVICPRCGCPWWRPVDGDVDMAVDP